MHPPISRSALPGGPRSAAGSGYLVLGSEADFVWPWGTLQPTRNAATSCLWVGGLVSTGDRARTTVWLTRKPLQSTCGGAGSAPDQDTSTPTTLAKCNMRNMSKDGFLADARNARRKGPATQLQFCFLCVSVLSENSVDNPN